MYINSERDLEDYICNNMEEFIIFLKNLYRNEKIDVEKIEFIGRQIVVGDSRMDLLFLVEDKSDDKFFEILKTYIVVELKFRNAEPKDIAQLSRYMNLLKALECDERIGKTLVDTKGILLTQGLNDEMQNIQIYLNNYTNADIKFVSLKTEVTFKEDSYSFIGDYIDKMSVDNRLKKVKQEVNESGEEKND
jgi:hypothetical protein